MPGSVHVAARYEPRSADAMSPHSRRAFLVCLIVSLALHALVLSGLPGMRVNPDEPVTIVQAQLQTIEPPPRVAPAPNPTPKPPEPPRVKPAPAAKAPAPAAPPRREADAQFLTPQTPDSAPPVAAADEAADEMGEPAVAAAPPPEPVAAAPVGAIVPDESRASTDEPPGDPAFPHAGSITYELFYGTDKFSVGRSVQTWSIEHGSYRLTSFSVTTGLVALFRPYQYAYVSEGRVEKDGLRPLTFTMSRGRGGERQAMARFDWSLHQLTYGPLHKPRRVPLEPGTYDFLSFIYQLARTQLTPGRMELTITTGTRLDTYVLEVGAEEELELPLGTVRAIPVRQVQVPGEESVQIWLAAERPQLPLRIRFLDRNGRLTVDQLATKIEIERA